MIACRYGSSEEEARQAIVALAAIGENDPIKLISLCTPSERPFGPRKRPLARQGAQPSPAAAQALEEYQSAPGIS
jgi:hypothetical protein